MVGPCAHLLAVGHERMWLAVRFSIVVQADRRAVTAGPSDAELDRQRVGTRRSDRDRFLLHAGWLQRRLPYVQRPRAGPVLIRIGLGAYQSTAQQGGHESKE